MAISAKNKDSIRKKINNQGQYKNGEKITISPVHVHTNEEIKSIRESLSMSQITFAKVLGTSHRTVQDWERGIQSPSSTVHRFLEIIALDNGIFEKHSIVKKQEEKSSSIDR